jgi:4-hydroxybenzoate polyprenyltransferase
MVAFLQLIRIRNLLIILFTQGLIYFGLFLPVFRKFQLTGPLSWVDFLLLFAFTAFIAAGGYIINDLVDTGPDSINKPDKVFIGHSISVSNAQWLYIGCVTASLMLAILMDMRCSTWYFKALHPVLNLGLAAYSLKLKKWPLAGNLLIAFFSALVPAIFLLFFKSGLDSMNSPEMATTKNWLISLVVAYTIFAFLSSLLREIVKDMEDLDGDRQFGIRSTAVALGMQVSKLIALALAIVLLFALIAWTVISTKSQPFMFWLYPVFLVSFLCYLIFKLQKSRHKSHYTRLSAEIKYFMLAGLLYLLIISLAKL